MGNSRLRNISQGRTNVEKASPPTYKPSASRTKEDRCENGLKGERPQKTRKIIAVIFIDGVRYCNLQGQWKQEGGYI